MLWVQCLLLKSKYWCGWLWLQGGGEFGVAEQSHRMKQRHMACCITVIHCSFLTLVLGFGILGFFQAQNLWFCHLRARFPSAVSIFFQRFFFFFGFFFLGPSSCWSEVMRGKRGCSLEFMASSPVKGSNEKQQQQLVGVHVPPQAIGTVVPPTLASPPACRPWDRRDLLRRLATYKSMSWFGKPQVGRLFLGLLDVICISH